MSAVPFAFGQGRFGVDYFGVASAPSGAFHYLLENGSGSLLLESGGSYYLLESSVVVTAGFRVQATMAGFYNGDYKDVGDVFDLISGTDFSSSVLSQVPVGNADYPIYGWMLQVPSSTPLFSWASSGLSSPRTSPRRTVQ